MTNRDYAINYLRLYWWNLTPLADLNLTTYADALKYYDRQSPTFLDQIGSVVKTLPQSKIAPAWKKLAEQYKTNYPPVGAFFDGLASSVTSFDASDAVDVAKGVASDLGSVAKWGLGGLATVALIGGIAYFLLMTGAGTKLLSRARGK